MHLPAIADDAGIDFDLFDGTDIMRDTPYFCDLRPGGGVRWGAVTHPGSKAGKARLFGPAKMLAWKANYTLLD